MGKVLELRYKDVENFAKGLNRKTKRGTDRLFINVVDTAMENTIKIAEERSLKWSGELKESWRKNIEPTQKVGKKYSKKATNEAFNERAEEAGMEGHYASFIEEGHKKVPWRKNTFAVPMLSGVNGAEVDTERKLQQIADNEVKKFFGGLFS